VHTANQIIEEYLAKGFDLTLRQLYYQFVARDLIPNTMKAYNRIKSIMNKARLAGLVDWEAITDRTRNVELNSHWTNPGSIIRSAAYSFMVDHWEDQPNRVEVWIEKDALKGVISGICERLDVPYFSCRGYTSVSEMWRAGNRLIANRKADQTTYVIHLGDHDPSGIDMSRDIADRLELFTGRHVELDRIALNMDQIEELGLPPNPAKLSDSRAQAYITSFGSDSWELDALDPEYMSNLIGTVVRKLRDPDLYAAVLEREGAMKSKLDELAEEHGHDNW
jgi:hypothetical protein